MNRLYARSETKTANYPKFYRLAKAQRVLARRTTGSIKENKQCIRVVKLHEK